jgi:hypothetical protein
VKDGEMVDPRPELTAQFVPGFVRSVLRHGPGDVGQDVLANQVLRILGGGILARGTGEPAVRVARTNEPRCEAKTRGAHGRVARAAAEPASRRHA